MIIAATALVPPAALAQDRGVADAAAARTIPAASRPRFARTAANGASSRASRRRRPMPRRQWNGGGERPARRKPARSSQAQPQQAVPQQQSPQAYQQQQQQRWSGNRGDRSQWNNTGNRPSQWSGNRTQCERRRHAPSPQQRWSSNSSSSSSGDQQPVEQQQYPGGNNDRSRTGTATAIAAAPASQYNRGNSGLERSQQQSLGLERLATTTAATTATAAGTSDRNRGSWNNSWRNDRRYDWRGYRSSNRNIYRLPRYYAPSGWGYGYRRFGIGFTLNSILFSSSYWINDPYYYRLPEVDGPYRWVRYYNDALLVDIYSGEVVDTIYDIFW
jgi:Ni/Co efflux regulator RcnB